jgi:hypothetical protein
MNKKIENLELTKFINSYKHLGFDVTLTQYSENVDLNIKYGKYLFRWNFWYHTTYKKFLHQCRLSVNVISSSNDKISSDYKSFRIMPATFDYVDNLGFTKMRDIIFKYTKKYPTVFNDASDVYFYFDMNEIDTTYQAPEAKNLDDYKKTIKRTKYKLTPQFIESKKLGFYDTHKKHIKRRNIYEKYIHYIFDTSIKMGYYVYITNTNKKIGGPTIGEVLRRIHLNIESGGTSSVLPNKQYLQKSDSIKKPSISCKKNKNKIKIPDHKHKVRQYIKNELNNYYNDKK